MATGDDILRNANKLFSKIGNSVKSAAKAVTGKGRGTVRIELERNRIGPGEPLRGTVKLALDEPIDARRLVVALIANQRTIEYSRQDGVRTANTTRVTLYRFDQELGGSWRYQSEELPFALFVPKDAVDRRPPAPSGTLGDVARAVSSVVAPTTGPVEWQVVVTLDIAMARNLEHSVDITVS